MPRFQGAQQASPRPITARNERFIPEHNIAAELAVGLREAELPGRIVVPPGLLPGKTSKGSGNGCERVLVAANANRAASIRIRKVFMASLPASGFSLADADSSPPMNPKRDQADLDGTSRRQF